MQSQVEQANVLPSGDSLPDHRNFEFVSPEKKKRPHKSQKVEASALGQLSSAVQELNMKLSHAIGDYEILKVVGRGTYGKVFKAKHKKTGTVVAIKYIKNVFKDYLRAKTIMREVCILRQLSQMRSNPHTNRLYDLISHESKDGSLALFIVMDYVSNNLREVLDASDSRTLTHEHAKMAFYSFLCGLNFLHSANLMHRDIKPTNLLMSRDFKVKICDFGLSRTVPATQSKINRLSRKKTAAQLVDERKERRGKPRDLSNHISTRWYRAPEVVVLEKKYNTAVDIWGAGCILGEFLCCLDKYKAIGVKTHQRYVFPGQSCYPLSPSTEEAEEPEDKDQLRVILSILGEQDKYDKSFISTKNAYDYIKDNESDLPRIDFENEFPQSPKAIVQLLSAMLQFNPFYRKTAKELLSSPVFDDIRDEKMENDAQFEISLPMDTAGAFDYETGDHDRKFGVTYLKEVLEKEIQLVKGMNIFGK